MNPSKIQVGHIYKGRKNNIMRKILKIILETAPEGPSVLYEQVGFNRPEAPYLRAGFGKPQVVSLREFAKWAEAEVF